MWRRLADALETLTHGTSDPAPVTTATALYDTYSVLLLYCGSCSPEIYTAVIRPQMMHADPAFSGRWARDFQPIGPMLRALQTAGVSGSLDQLFTAATNNDRIHRAVANRLVPGGWSLLRTSGRGHDAPPTEDESNVYDAFFGVGHERPTYAECMALMRQLLSVVRADLVANPLPVPCGWEGFSLTDIALVERFHRDSVAILDDLEGRIGEPA